MKRAADLQLTKDSSDDNQDDSEVGTGFQRADPSVLGTRKIRGLPKRNVASSSAPSVPNPPVATPASSSGTAAEDKPPESASRFGTFTGFGTGAPSTFNFSVPKSQNPTTIPQSTNSSPGLFSSAFSSATSNSFTTFSNPSNPTPPSTPPSKSDFPGGRDHHYKYYLDLRGLNSCFLAAATTAIQSDPFVDITEILETYRSHRLSVQRELDGRLNSSRSNQETKQNPPSAAFQQPFTKAADFSFKPTNSRPETTAGTNGLPAATPSGFTPKLSSSSGTSTSPFPWIKPSGPTSISDKPPSGESSSPFGNTTTPSAQSNPSLNGESKPVAPTPEAHLTVKSQPPFTNDKPPAKNAPIFEFKPMSIAPLTPGLSSFLSSPKPSGEASTPPPVKFGVTSSSPSFSPGSSFASGGPFGSFSKNVIGNHVGFGFGSQSSTTSTSDTASASGTKAPTDTAAVEDKLQADEAEASSNTVNTEHDPSPVPSQGSSYDVDGPGEEEESTVHETRAKAYKMNKGWTSVGTGQLKIKAHKELAKRRVLMRNSSTGQVILNFNLFSAFQFTVDKREISFRVPGEDDSAAVYRFRVSKESDALEWQETIQRELDNLAASNET